MEWGGADMVVVPPPPVAGAAAAVGPTEERIPEGAILYYVTPAGGTATLTPIGEIGADGLLPIRARADWDTYDRGFIAAHLRAGTEFALFRAGARVGTLVLESADVPSADACPRAPSGRGVLELMAGADTIPEFLALAKAHAPSEAGRVAAVPSEPDRRMQILGPILAERLLRARGAPLPGNWTRAMAQLAPFPVAGHEEPAFAATFLVSDSLGVGRDDEGYSLFFIAEPAAELGYDTTYARFTPYEQQGKAAPRVVDYLDWNRDGRSELLLEVYGTDRTWYEAVGRSRDGWASLLTTRCE